jgi:hypothetical protein
MHSWAQRLALASGLLICQFAAFGSADDDSLVTQTELEQYEIQLNSVLRTRLDAEKDFVHDVVALIQEGKLPRKLVDKSMLWVRNRRIDEDKLFAYFERVLRIQAERLRLEIPAFDYGVYDSSNR